MVGVVDSFEALGYLSQHETENFSLSVGKILTRVADRAYKLDALAALARVSWLQGLKVTGAPPLVATGPWWGVSDGGEGAYTIEGKQLIKIWMISSIY